MSIVQAGAGRRRRGGGVGADARSAAHFHQKSVQALDGQKWKYSPDAHIAHIAHFHSKKYACSRWAGMQLEADLHTLHTLHTFF